MAGLDRLGAALREMGYATADTRLDASHFELASLARGRPVAADSVADVLGDDALEALAQAGAIDLDGGTLAPRFSILGARSLLAVLPKPLPDCGDMVYFGPDSLWLLQCVWGLAVGGRIAVELGTGTGYIAAALATRYELTIATDILPTTAAVAALTFRLNRTVRR